VLQVSVTFAVIPPKYFSTYVSTDADPLEAGFRHKINVGDDVRPFSQFTADAAAASSFYA
jgi:hypothetical protein